MAIRRSANDPAARDGCALVVPLAHLLAVRVLIAPALRARRCVDCKGTERRGRVEQPVVDEWAALKRALFAEFERAQGFYIADAASIELRER